MVTGEREEIRIGQLAIRFLIEGQASGGSVAVFEFDVPAGAKVPAAHSHDAYEETIYGLEGVLTLTVEGRQSEVGPGDVLCIPRGKVHRFDNCNTVDAKMLAIVSPGILGPDYFRETAAVIKAAAGGPPNPTALAEVMRRHGLTPAPQRLHRTRREKRPHLPLASARFTARPEVNRILDRSSLNLSQL